MTVVLELNSVDWAKIAFAVVLCIPVVFLASKRACSRRRDLPAAVEAEKNSPDCVIIGGGVVGAALATCLARQGRKVTVIESSMAEPDRIVGELLQPRGVQSLKNIRLEEALEGIDASPVAGYAVFKSGKHFRACYPDSIEGVGFHNGRFVMRLRALAQKEKNVTFIEGNVTKILRDSDSGAVIGVKYRTKSSSDGAGEKTLKTPLTVLAAGCLSSLRKEFVSESDKSTISRFLGLVVDNCPSPYPKNANVILADPAPILCYPISSTEHRILIDFPGHLPRSDNGDLQKHLRESVVPFFPKEMQASVELAIHKGKFQSMPNQSMGAHPKKDIPGILIIGDQLNMRHPLTGGGMTVGMKDVEIIVDQFKTIKNFREDYDELNKSIERFYKLRKAPNSVINILADALYQVFHQKHEDMRQGCFDYLAKGGWYVAGPISFLSGISESQTFLLFHFFAVAVYGVLGLLKPFPTFSGLLRSFSLLRDAVHIIFPLVMRSGTNYLLYYSVVALRALFLF